MKRKDISRCACVVFVLLACDSRASPASDDGEPAHGRARPTATEVAELGEGSSVAEDGAHAGHPMPEAAVIPDAKAAFADAVALIEDNYVDGPLDEDALWTAALHGVMSRLIQLEGERINELLSPAKSRELLAGVKGEIVGVGVAIKRVADVVVVVGITPASPAARADLRVGDRILAIDDARVGDLELAEIVDRIRGEAGATVKLFVQRETDEWTVSLERERIAFSSVEATMLDDTTGLIRISGFAKRTADELDAALDDLQTRGMQRLVLDLRRCPGGLLESALAAADLFLPQGARIVGIEDASGAVEHRDASGDGRWSELEVVTLIGPATASGAEVLALALAEHERTTLVGEPSKGKGTVEAVVDLRDDWKLKLSTARLLSPSGDRRHGQPVVPDLEIAEPHDGADKHVPIERLHAKSDAAIAAATTLLRRR